MDMSVINVNLLFCSRNSS